MHLSCNCTGFYPTYGSGKCYWIASVWPTSSNSGYPRPSALNHFHACRMQANLLELEPGN